MKDRPTPEVSRMEDEEYDQIPRVGGFSLNWFRFPAKTGPSQEEGLRGA